MMSAALAVQKAIRDRLVDTPAVTDLVPADAILDRNKRPVPTPSIILGEVQVVDDGESIARRRERVIHTVHVWKKEASLVGANAILGAIRAALTERLVLGEGWHCGDSRVSGMRTLRDPDGETSHGVITIELEVTT